MGHAGGVAESIRQIQPKNKIRGAANGFGVSPDCFLKQFLFVVAN